MPTYAMGDLHGMSSLLFAALAGIRAHAAGRPRTIVFLGDYVDRGPDGRGVIDALKAGPEDRDERWIPLKGNHDEMMVGASREDDGDFADWMANGGRQTYRQYFLGVGETTVDRYALREDGDFLKSLPLWHEDGKRIFVHAGLRPGGGPNQQRAHDMTWIRDDFLNSRYDFGVPIVHGHTPTCSRLPEIHSNRVALDTAACQFSGRLSVGIFEEDPWPTGFLAFRHPEPDGTIRPEFHDAEERRYF